MSTKPTRKDRLVCSAVSRVRERFTAVVDDLAHLITEIPVNYFDREGDGVVFVCPEYHWGEPTNVQRAGQLELKRDYEAVRELINLFLQRAPQDLARELRDADSSFRTWIELDSNWSLSPNRHKNDASLRATAAKIEKILMLLESVGASEVIVVPDTNSLLKEADPALYRSIAGSDHLVFMLLPTVLGELDRLKIEHKNPDVRDKAQSVIRRIKGWRHQGALNAGVCVDHSITVRAKHSEPDMEHSLSWLDSRVEDDRIIASVLALQAEQPSSRIVLVTGDINLQNKADAALIETAEHPEA